MIFGLLFAVWFVPLQSRGTEALQEVSLVALLANPQAYEGKLLRVEGYFDGSHFESCRLFLTKADFEHHIARNSIVVMWPGCRERRVAARMQRRYMTIEGVFQADVLSFPAIREVRKLEPKASRSERFGRAPWWYEARLFLPLGLLFVVTTTIGAYRIAWRVRGR